MEEYRINGYIATERLLKALASKSRLEILQCVEKGISNPGEIARRLNRHRSTMEKHLKILLKAKIVKKVPSLTEGGRLTIRYALQQSIQELLATIQDLSQKILKPE